MESKHLGVCRNNTCLLLKKTLQNTVQSGDLLGNTNWFKHFNYTFCLEAHLSEFQPGMRGWQEQGQSVKKAAFQKTGRCSWGNLDLHLYQYQLSAAHTQLHGFPTVVSCCTTFDPYGPQVEACPILLRISKQGIHLPRKIINNPPGRGPREAVAWPLPRSHQQNWAPLQCFTLVGTSNSCRHQAVSNRANVLATFSWQMQYFVNPMFFRRAWKLSVFWLFLLRPAFRKRLRFDYAGSLFSGVFLAQVCHGCFLRGVWACVKYVPKQSIAQHCEDERYHRFGYVWSMYRSSPLCLHSTLNTTVRSMYWSSPLRSTLNTNVTFAKTELNAGMK